MNYSTARAHSEDRRPQRDLQNFLSFELVRHSLLHLLPPAPARGSNDIINFYFTRTRGMVHPMPATSDPAHAHAVSRAPTYGTAPAQQPGSIPTVTARSRPPVELLRLDARRNCRRKRPDALANQTRAVTGDPV